MTRHELMWQNLERLRCGASLTITPSFLDDIEHLLEISRLSMTYFQHKIHGKPQLKIYGKVNHHLKYLFTLDTDLKDTWSIKGATTS